uniref:Golgi membrane protein 1 n=1 Tax=Suricata suricatta TaxID=37032 RepID=A0A673TWG8_SURSU
MMGLGNGRRSMKSPPLVLAALVACIIVLGFNYWIASSRSVDLQTRILELEGRVRRAAAERGAVELKKNEFQGELEKQREQLDRIQSSHDSQLESVNKIYQDEKVRPALVSPHFCSRCQLRHQHFGLDGRMSDCMRVFVMMCNGPLDHGVAC